MPGSVLDNAQLDVLRVHLAGQVCDRTLICFVISFNSERCPTHQ